MRTQISGSAAQHMASSSTNATGGSAVSQPLLYRDCAHDKCSEGRYRVSTTVFCSLHRMSTLVEWMVEKGDHGKENELDETLAVKR